MKVLRTSNVNGALSIGTYYMNLEGEETESRGMRVLEYPEPVCTVYDNPTERMLINKHREANPFFHLHEAMWILGGRQDVSYLSYFVPRMAEFSDDGVSFNAPYGYRLRHEFDKDQIEELIALLRTEPDTRRAVLQIWSAEKDLNTFTKDHACNTTVYFKIKDGKLNMLVSCRSNDMLWGAYGANAVQFSVLQEYIAAMCDVSVGQYRQVSDSFHVYLDGPGGKLWEKIKANSSPATFIEPYQPLNMEPTPMVTDQVLFRKDLTSFLQCPPDTGVSGTSYLMLQPWFNMLFHLQEYYLLYRQGDIEKAIASLKNRLNSGTPYYDIYTAALVWLETKQEKQDES